MGGEGWVQWQGQWIKLPPDPIPTQYLKLLLRSMPAIMLVQIHAIDWADPDPIAAAKLNLGIPTNVPLPQGICEHNNF